MMKIQLSGHHVEITEGLREAVNRKFNKVISHHPEIESIAVRLTVEPNEQRVEVDTRYFGSTISVHAKDDDLYVAINDAAKKFDSALSHKRGVAKPR